MSRFLIPVPVLLLASLLAVAEPPLKATPLGDANAAAAKLAEQLGDRDFHTREAASKQLEALGEAALPALRAVQGTGNPEAVRRATAVVTRIQAKTDNSRAISPKVVDLAIDDQPVRTALVEVEKQTGYRIQVNGDLAVLDQKVTFALKQVSFWDAVDAIADKCGLQFDAATSAYAQMPQAPAYVDPRILQQRQLEQDRIRGQSDKLKVELAVHQNKEVKVAAALAKAKEKEEKAQLTAEAAALRTEIAALKKKIATLEQQMTNALPPPAGTVSLRAAGTAKPNPSCVAGAVRVQANPFPGQVGQVSAETIPLVLTLTPEPKVRWVRTTSFVVTKANTPDGRTLNYDPTAGLAESGGHDGMEQLQWRGRGRAIRFKGEYYGGPVQTQDILGGYAATPFQSMIRLTTPTGEPVTKLASVEGVVRGKLWTKPETVLALTAVTSSPTRTFGLNKTFLEAKITPDANDKSAYVLELQLDYDTTEVNPNIAADQSVEDPLYFEQVPGGRVRPVRPVAKGARAQNGGLGVADEAGVPYSISLQSSEARQSFDPFTGQNAVLSQKQRYVVRATKADQGPPTQVTFTATRMREVELPFKLANVPVAAGTQDPKTVVPQPQQYPIYDR